MLRFGESSRTSLTGLSVLLRNEWLDWIKLPNCKEATIRSIKLRFGESSRRSLTGLSVLLRNAMFIFTLVKPVGSIIGRRPKFRPAFFPEITPQTGTGFFESGFRKWLNSWRLNPPRSATKASKRGFWPIITSVKCSKCRAHIPVHSCGARTRPEARISTIHYEISSSCWFCVEMAFISVIFSQ